MRFNTIRVSRDWFYPSMWAVQTRRWWWPFWIEEIGMLKTYDEALAMIEILRRNY